MISSLDSDILAIHRRRLHKLEELAAVRGQDTPPEIAIEIEDLRKKVAAGAAVPENGTDQFVFLRDLIQLGRAETAELRRDVRLLAVLLFATLLVQAIVERL